MNAPTLIVMAAGMGSRYGGLKQIDPVTEQGEIIIDFSLYDALMAGFEEVVFIIKKEMEKDVRALMDGGAGRRVNIKYAYQDIAEVPAGFAVPEGREKPWGTGHAVLAAKALVDGPFAVINSDDYYGPAAYQLMHEYLMGASDDDMLRYAMVAYRLANTVTEHGSVARGICRIDGSGNLAGIDERLKVARRDGGIAYEDENGEWVGVPAEQPVSMNFWGFTKSFMGELESGLSDFFENDVPQNPQKAEYLLPRIVDRLLAEGRAAVNVMESDDRWYGVTYKEDKAQVMAAMQSLKDRGLYPEKLWR
ncbi:MAG: nucleotidyltransferase [Clostridiales Family XIII bacterium]|jgi:dTDP-glucose pyrophosphorylase|nr:nucleotidyltransferase [Clostridiales Family XIII bacterium]